MLSDTGGVGGVTGEDYLQLRWIVKVEEVIVIVVWDE